MSLRKSSLLPRAADDTAPLSTPALSVVDDEYYTEGVSGFGDNPPPPESFEPTENPLAA